MLSGHVEGQLLKFLVRMTSAVRVLEIGMFTGYSALAMAEALPAHGLVVACEIDSGATEIARAAFDVSGVGERVRIERDLPWRRCAGWPQPGRPVFDFVFLDADKGGYQSYLDLLLDSDLLAPGAVIAVDNTLMQGQPWTAGDGPADPSTANGAAIAAFNRAWPPTPGPNRCSSPCATA